MSPSETKEKDAVIPRSTASSASVPVPVQKLAEGVAAVGFAEPLLKFPQLKGPLTPAAAEKLKIQEILGRKLLNRPAKETLINQNIIKGDARNGEDSEYPQMAGPLSPASGKTKLHEILGRKLLNRPPKEALINQNIIKENDSKVATKDPQLQLLIERNLKAKLREKYCHVIQGDDVSMLRKEAGPLLRRRDSDSETKKSLVSSWSRERKSQFIAQLQAENRFVCVNCCSEDFEGFELSSSRYTYQKFFGEEEWNEIGNVLPFHSPGAKAAQLCNACFGTCSCGVSIDGAPWCENCGSLAPVPMTVRSAPEYPRPRYAEDLYERRSKQLVKSPSWALRQEQHHWANSRSLPSFKKSKKFSESGPMSVSFSAQRGKNQSHKSNSDSNEEHDVIEKTEVLNDVSLANLASTSAKQIQQANSSNIPSFDSDSDDTSTTDDGEDPAINETWDAFERYRYFNPFTQQCLFVLDNEVIDEETLEMGPVYNDPVHDDRLYFHMHGETFAVLKGPFLANGRLAPEDNKSGVYLIYNSGAETEADLFYYQSFSGPFMVWNTVSGEIRPVV